MHIPLLTVSSYELFERPSYLRRSYTANALVHIVMFTSHHITSHHIIKVIVPNHTD